MVGEILVPFSQGTEKKGKKMQEKELENTKQKRKDKIR
jgi:hypothetical protein